MIHPEPDQNTKEQGADRAESGPSVVEQVAFAEGTKQEYKSALIAFGPQLSGWMIMSVTFVPGVILACMATWVMGRFGTGAMLWFLGVTALFVALGFGTRIWRRLRSAYDEGMELTKLPLSADGRGRVRCIGRQATVRRLGPIPEEPFEPVIVRVVVASKPSRAFVWTWVVSGVLAVVGVLAMFRYVLSGVGPGTSPWTSFMYFYFAFGASAGSLIATFVFPTYLRITPGRLDVFKFPALGRGRPEVSTFDLKRLNVTLLLNQSSIVLESSPDAGMQFVTFAASFDRLGTSRALLAAAVSPHPTPPLPDDTLLG